MKTLRKELAKRYGNGAIRCSTWCITVSVLYGALAALAIYLIFNEWG